jgi:LacI family transcriptional regulator
MRKRRKSRPTVALIVESSHASGRNILRGFARYVREHGPWSVFHEFRNTDWTFPEWVEAWSGDGVIARIESERIATSLGALGVPVVDLLGSVPGCGFPLVHPNDTAIAKMAANHLLERGFR